MNQTKLEWRTSISPQPFTKRFWIYLKERFPLLKHILLIGTFTFSAIGYTRLSRGTNGFIPIEDYLTGVFITFTLFFLLRIADEFKDKEEDAKFRPYLPVPRGLISLQELKYAALVILGLQIVVIAFWQPALWQLYALILFYLFLMRVEFFVPKWLKARPILYVTSHMMIIPLVDCFASGLDWLNNSISAPKGLIFFFVVSFMNGIVLEFGRKIRTPENEEEGVQSYTSLYGTKRAVIYWLIALALTALASIMAAKYAGFSKLMQWLFPVFMIICSIPAFLFIKKPTVHLSKWIEKSSGIWTLGMYLILGGLPSLWNLITS